MSENQYLANQAEDLPRVKHGEMLRRYLTLEGLRILDIGCGDGALVRSMARDGAQVIGMEINEAGVARARRSEPAADERYLVGLGEALPIADQVLDVVMFFNSLHHVPVGHQGAALSEAARVVKPGGFVYVLEPLAEGAYFELLQPIEDETHVRELAYEAMKAAQYSGEVLLEREVRYEAPYKLASFETMIENLLAAKEERRQKIESLKGYLRVAFNESAEERDGAFWFYQPCRLNLFKRP